MPWMMVRMSRVLARGARQNPHIMLYSKMNILDSHCVCRHRADSTVQSFLDDSKSGASNHR